MMGKRTTRIAVIGSIGVMLLVAAFLAGSPVTATGTGTCDPFDVNCLKTANLYGADICSSTNTNCLVSYQSLGIAVCAPTNTVCATTYASVIRTTVPATPIATLDPAIYGTPISTAALGTVLASGTGIPSTIPPNTYGIDLCSLTDTNCLLSKQALGIPICPPDDQVCRDKYNAIYAPIRTYTPRDQTPYAQSTYATGGYQRNIVVGNSNDPNTAGVIHTLGR